MAVPFIARAGGRLVPRYAEDLVLQVLAECLADIDTLVKEGEKNFFSTGGIHYAVRVLALTGRITRENGVYVLIPEVKAPLSPAPVHTPVEQAPVTPVTLVRKNDAIMKYVMNHPGCTTNEVAGGLHIVPSNVRDILKKLEWEKQVVRSPDPGIIHWFPSAVEVPGITGPIMMPSVTPTPAPTPTLARSTPSAPSSAPPSMSASARRKRDYMRWKILCIQTNGVLAAIRAGASTAKDAAMMSGVDQEATGRIIAKLAATTPPVVSEEAERIKLLRPRYRVYLNHKPAPDDEEGRSRYSANVSRWEKHASPNTKEKAKARKRKSGMRPEAWERKLARSRVANLTGEQIQRHREINRNSRRRCRAAMTPEELQVERDRARQYRMKASTKDLSNNACGKCPRWHQVAGDPAYGVCGKDNKVKPATDKCTRTP